jgi:excisionase family DNA binding protein
VAGSDHTFRIEEFADTMRSRIVSVFSEALATARVPILDAVTKYSELGGALLPLINPVMETKYGLAVETFVVENISLPQEVEEAIDKRASMAAVGNLNDFVKYQMAEGMEKGGGGAGGMATEMAVGLAIAQQMMQQQGGALSAGTTPGPAVAGDAAAGGGLPGLLSPEEVARALKVSEKDVLSIIDAGELRAKRIGESVRIRREDLEAYLAG